MASSPVPPNSSEPESAVLASVQTTTEGEAAAEFPGSSNAVPSPGSSQGALNLSPARKRTNLSDRLRKLGQDFGKFRPTNDKSVPASPRVTINEVQSPRNEISSQPEPYETPDFGSGQAKLLSMVAELEGSGSTPTSESTLDAIDLPERTTLAKRIEALIDSLPFPSFNVDKKLPILKDSKSPTSDSDGRHIPPVDTPAINDSNLVGLLSSPSVMNGSTLKGKPSMWSILEGLSPPRHAFPGVAEDADLPNRTDDRVDQDTIFSDTSSVMIYSPLIPTNDDLLELAEFVPVGVQEVPATEGQLPIPGTSWSTIWPLSLLYATPSLETQRSVMPARRLSGETVNPRQSSTDSPRQPLRVQSTRAWVPSNTKLSVQAMWWGYRLYLPPPVLAILSDKTLEATKRAAMITTALTWFFNNLPISSLPPAVMPAALLFQRLAPFLGYIGTFISWSWSTIKSYDIGYGVTLTATWLLPIALIPGTWHQQDFPISPTQGSSASLPPTSPPTSYGSSHLLTSTVTSPAYTFSPLSSPTTGSPSLYPSPYTLAHLSPQSMYVSLLSPGAPTPSYTRVVVDIPVPLAPDDLPPVPPTADVAPVPLGSPLMAQLLNGPVISTVPLPDEDAPSPVMGTDRKKDARSRAKALFTRSSRPK
ncbi:hypothetical protein HYPSUDRAFT_1080755 [Hypholoma sublateritium FD-334 SS-4]|uniref:Uncharacterized protein n=1 Tax=Hypholoma sublateritium (strain FD-334 SS-4) TaxID=945553 RepID=A0A0D2PV87_HYPSF|nr:hypothetical protein HYPSUDRAFT_1080755 [Hypholoma sublateritium FD-334 SS-4]